MHGNTNIKFKYTKFSDNRMEIIMLSGGYVGDFFFYFLGI